MYSLCFLILCSLLQAGTEPATSGRLPAVTPKPFIPTAPVQTVPIPPLAAAPPTEQPPQQLQGNPNQLLFRNGLLALPERSMVTLSAPDRAVIALLQTEQRDADGNIVQDETGKPMMVPLREGMNVVKGQILGNFDDRELRSMLKINQAQLEVALAEQEKRIEVIYAIQSLRHAMQEQQMYNAVNKGHDNTVSKMELERAKLAVEQAQANVELQKYNLEEVKTREVVVRQNELERTEVQIEQRKLIAAIDGMIVKIYAAEGEWIQEGNPVLDIYQLDTLLVRVNVDARRYHARDLDGKKAMISVTLTDGQTATFPGTVVFCTPRIDAGNTFEVLIEVQNRREGNYWLLQPGQDNVDIVIPL